MFGRISHVCPSSFRTPSRRRRLPPRTSRSLLEILESRLAPSVTLSISSPQPFPEGDSGTSNMVFVVMRSGDLAPAVQANYTTVDGTAHAGTDYVATSGTVSFAPNQTMATIAVPIIGNTLVQSDRTFGATLQPAAQRLRLCPPADLHHRHQS